MDIEYDIIEYMFYTISRVKWWWQITDKDGWYVGRRGSQQECCELVDKILRDEWNRSHPDRPL